jgi:outer membrane protein assembly factor BamE
MRKNLIFKGAGIILLTLAFSNCSSLEFPGVYRLDIPQGNLIDQEKITQLKIGMEPRQVRYLLGTPLIVDTFNQDRWDYFYSIRKNKKEKIEHHISILFDNGQVSAIQDNIKH